MVNEYKLEDLLKLRAESLRDLAKTYGDIVKTVTEQERLIKVLQKQLEGG